MYPLQNRFFVNALYGEDQLRQRVAFALHQIIVVSGVDITQPSWMAPYLQMLDRNAFGNYRQLLYDITLNPAMGNYLDINGNTQDEPERELRARDPAAVLDRHRPAEPRRHAAARRRRPADSRPTTRTIVNNFARVFTGWRFAPAPATGVPNYIDPMVVNEPQHDIAAKTLLNGAVLPANQNTAQDLNDALDNIFKDPNIGPFISKQLIQHLVTSNPSPAYVDAGRRRVQWRGGDARRPEGGGSGHPARSRGARATSKADANYGRLRHPAQFIANVLRAFNARSADGATTERRLSESPGGQHGDGPVPPAIGVQLLLTGHRRPRQRRRARAGVRHLLDLDRAAPRQLRQHDGLLAHRRRRERPGGHLDRPGAAQALAANPGQLVDALNTLLLHGTMSTEMRSSIVTAVSAVAASNPLKRARTAVYLVATSSQYQVER